jgi:hypothetical protein
MDSFETLTQASIIDRAPACVRLDDIDEETLDDIASEAEEETPHLATDRRAAYTVYVGHDERGRRWEIHVEEVGDDDDE